MSAPLAWRAARAEPGTRSSTQAMVIRHRGATRLRGRRRAMAWRGRGWGRSEASGGIHRRRRHEQGREPRLRSSDEPDPRAGERQSLHDAGWTLRVLTWRGAAESTRVFLRDVMVAATVELDLGNGHPLPAVRFRVRRWIVD